jgi:predicted transcriptional regulator of viral defense system
LDHPEHSGGIEEVAKALYFAKESLDFKKLVRFAKKIGNNAVVKRLGYLSETLKLERSLRLLSKASLASGYSLLDPTLARHGRITERWKLILNTKIEETRWTR